MMNWQGFDETTYYKLRDDAFKELDAIYDRAALFRVAHQLDPKMPGLTHSELSSMADYFAGAVQDIIRAQKHAMEIIDKLTRTKYGDL